MLVIRMETHPVTIALEPPERWARAHVLVRIGIVVVLALLGAPLGWLYGVFFVLLPVIAALVISEQGAVGYLMRIGPRIALGLRWWNALLAYLFFLTDRFPLPRAPGGPLEAVQFRLVISGSPSVRTALLRWLTSLLEFILLGLLAWVLGLVLLVAAVCVLVRRSVPGFALRYSRFVLNYQAKLLAYHASLVEVHALPGLGGEITAPASEP